MNGKSPIIYLLFSDQRVEPLPQIESEMIAVQNYILDLSIRKKIEIITRENPSEDQVLLDIETYQNRIIIFHYAGHFLALSRLVFFFMRPLSQEF